IFPSYENFVSGEGLLNIYKSIKNLKDSKNFKDPGGYVRKKAKEGEKEGMEAIKFYFLALALYCQTLALALKPLKGIFFGGKAIKRNFEFFPKKEFIEIFTNHPKQEKLLKKIPIYFIKKDLIFEGLLYFYKFNEKS
ncbi:MAG: glucokinase, partial [Thermoanaerobaculia bacterium]